MAAAPPSPRPRDILIVEDDPDQRDLLRRGFDRLGLGERVAYASSCGEAWDVLARGDVRVVLSDLSLGFESGLDLLLAVPGGAPSASPPARALYSAAMPDDLAWLAREQGITVLAKGVRFHREIPEAVARLLGGGGVDAGRAGEAPR